MDESSIPERIVRSTPLREKRIAKYRGYVAWREEYGIDTILRTPKPYFALIKKYYPHALHKTGKGRNACSIQIEKAGQFGAPDHFLRNFKDDWQSMQASEGLKFSVDPPGARARGVDDCWPASSYLHY